VLQAYVKSTLPVCVKMSARSVGEKQDKKKSVKCCRSPQKDTCAICLKELQEQTNLGGTSCGHVYCLSCIVVWIDMSGYTCLICRSGFNLSIGSCSTFLTNKGVVRRRILKSVKQQMRFTTVRRSTQKQTMIANTSDIKRVDCATQTTSQRYTIDLRKAVIQRTTQLRYEQSMTICHLISKQKGDLMFDVCVVDLLR